MMYVEGGPAHPFSAAMTVIVPEIAEVPELVAVKLGTLPLPPAPSPIAVFEFDHVKVAPAGMLLKFVAATLAPGQTEKFAGTLTVGRGLIVNVVEAGVVPHSFVTERLIVFNPIVENVVELGVAELDVKPVGTLVHEYVIFEVPQFVTVAVGAKV